MNFPILTNIDSIKEAISGKDEFTILEKPDMDYATVDYFVVFKDTFPEIETLSDALVRECRGLTFQLSTGKILSRKYHKFFNICERPETLPENIDFSQPHIVLEKLDGSLITPMLIDGNIFFCSKNGLTDISKPVDNFAKENKSLHAFCKEMISLELTPLFEWCSPIQQIVLDYNESRLILTGIRNNISGEYLPYSTMEKYRDKFNLDIVKIALPPITDIDQFIKETRKITFAEGYVIRFNNGLMLKIKGDWYVQIHKVIDQIKHEKNIIKLIIEQSLDDIIGVLPTYMQSPLQEFSDDFNRNISTLAKELNEFALTHKNTSKKEYAGLVMLHYPKLSRMAFAARNGDDVTEIIHNMIIRFSATQPRIDSVKHLFGNISWKDYI